MGRSLKVGERNHLTSDEIEALLIAAKSELASGDYKLRNYLLLGMSYRHGLRSQEVLSLKWKDIEFDKSRFYITRAKGSISGYHPLLELDYPETERRYLMELRSLVSSEYVFVSRTGSCLSYSMANKIIKKVSLVAGLNVDVNLHKLRHSTATHMALKNRPALEIQNWLGHKSITNTMVYIHRVSNMANVVERWW